MSYLEAYVNLVEVAKKCPLFVPAINNAIVFLFTEDEPPLRVAFAPPKDVVLLYNNFWVTIDAVNYKDSLFMREIQPKWTSEGIKLHFETLLDYYNAKQISENGMSSGTVR